MEGAVTIRPARERADYDACVALQRTVWGLDDLEITPAIQLIATVHAGGLLLVAEAAGRAIVGFSYAFAGLRHGQPHLHSDMLAVVPELRGRGVGTRLKWAQREEALRRGLSLVTWTFDPMQARNASLNLRRLGAVASELLPDFYGTTSSALHHGLPTDRLFVRWELDSARVHQRATAGERPGAAEAPPLPRINAVAWRADLPVSSAPTLGLEATQLLLEIPAEWEQVCGGAPELARAWQASVRASFQAYFARGYAAVDLLLTEDSGRRRPLYLLQRAR
jgi:predicted GNAT superfamily acetyltransferase